MSINDEAKSSDELSAVIDLLEKNLKYLTAIGLNDVTLRSYHKLVVYLRSRSGTDAERILGSRSSSSTKKKAATFVLTDDQIRQFDVTQVKSYLLDPDLPRSALEHIATIRFGMTKGAISSLGNRRALVDKIQTLIDHEGTHEVISRAAIGKPPHDA